ncbi:MAG: hypothetical protein ACLR4Z_00475 [Butyricicoccaceae bacterium]
MFASMCTLMVLNVMFVKMLLSAMSNSPTGVAIVPWIMLITGIVTRGEKDGQHYPAYRTQSGYHWRPAGASSRSGYAQCHAGASRGIVYQKHDLESAAPHQYGCGSAVPARWPMAWADKSVTDSLRSFLHRPAAVRRTIRSRTAIFP